MTFAQYTAPGLTLDEGKEISEVLQARLHDLNELHLSLKHAHWNVTGPDFIAVHEMIDPQVDTVRNFVDDIAERMATLGATPNGLAGALVAARSHDDYPVGRARVTDHLHALNEVYTRVIKEQRKAIEFAGKVDPITEDLLIGQTAELEKFQWFIRAFLENSAGEISLQAAFLSPIGSPGGYSSLSSGEGTHPFCCHLSRLLPGNHQPRHNHMRRIFRQKCGRRWVRHLGE